MLLFKFSKYFHRYIEISLDCGDGLTGVYLSDSIKLYIRSTYSILYLTHSSIKWFKKINTFDFSTFPFYPVNS